jgi:2'-5' RNA ligase
VLLELADTADLVHYQAALIDTIADNNHAGELPNFPVRWTSTEQFHITLVHCPLVDEVDLRAAYERVVGSFQGLTIHTTGVSTFASTGDGEGQARPVILRVEPSAPLLELQRAVYEVLQERHVVMSEHSTPEAYTPHITLGYVPSWVDVPEVLVDLMCAAAALVFSRGDYETVHRIEHAASEAYALNELRAWRRATLAHGREKGLRFVCHHLAEEVQAVLRAELAACDGSKTALAMLFNNARARLERGDEVPTYASGKSIQTTRLEFEAAFSDMLRAVVDEQMDRRRFGTVLRALLRTFGTQAYRDGLIDGGLEDGTLDDDDQATLNQLLAEQSAYVTAIGGRLFREDGRFEAQDSAKPLLWWNKSVVPLYQAGRLSADKNGLYEFAGEDGAESCATCQRLKGQRHRLKDWARHNLIPPGEAPDFECGGWQCKHQLIKVTGQARGTF